MSSEVAYTEYRAVAYDAALSDEVGEARDVGRVQPTRVLAERDLAEMCDGADPPYDDGWVEMRFVGHWSKVARDTRSER